MWISVFLGNSVEAPEINAKSKRAIFLPDKEDRSSMGRAGRMDEPCSKVLVNELTKSHKFLLGQGVYRTIGWCGALVQCDFEIIRSMVGKFDSFGFTEHVRKVMIVFGNRAHVDRNLGSGRGMTSDFGKRDTKLETVRAFELACVGIRSCINEGYSRGFPWVYQRNRFRKFRDRVRKIQKGADDGSVST